MTVKVDIGSLECVSKSTNPDVKVLLEVSRSMATVQTATDSGCGTDNETSKLRSAAQHFADVHKVAFEALSVGAEVLTKHFKGAASDYAQAEGGSYAEFEKLKRDTRPSSRRGPVLEDPSR